MMAKIKGLSPHTGRIIEAVSKLECIKSYLLVGGTALSLQLGTRESEDLDFMNWRRKRNERREVNWPQIKKELESVGVIEKMEILDMDHVEFIVNGVKLSFYANPNYSPVPKDKEVTFFNNLRLADPTSIGAMKMEVMLRRSKYRDYYDIYSLVKAGYDLKEMIELSLKYSGHKLKSKNILALLTRSERFVTDDNFKTLNPIYDITPKDIEDCLKRILVEKIM